MEKIVLAAETREVGGKKVAAVRKAGKVPAVVYGNKTQAQAIALDSKLLDKAYAHAGGNRIIGLKIDDTRQKNALIHDVQLNVITGKVEHADFYLVNMSEKIKAEIPIHVTGESTAVYQMEGTLLRPLETVEIEALPGDLPESFEVDISVLDDFEKSIHVSDLVLSEGVELLTPLDELIAKVDPPRSEEEMAELDEDITEVLPEGVADEDQTAEKDGEADKKPEGKDNTGA